MKKILSLFIIVLFSQISVFAVDSFNYNDQNVNKEFEKLSVIENYISANPEVNLDILKANEPNMLDGLIIENTTVSVLKGGGDLPGNIPAFVWGCCLNVVGLIIVYAVTDNDREQVKKALYGCLVSGLLVGGCFLIGGLGGGSSYYWY